MIVAAPALEIAPLDRLILRIGKDQRTILRERRRSQRKKNDDCRDPAKNRKAKNQTWRRTPPHCEFIARFRSR